MKTTKNYVNSKIRHKSKSMSGVIRNLVLGFILYFVTAYMRKYPIYVTSVRGPIQNTIYITWRSHYKIFYDEQFATGITHKNVQYYYNEK